MATVTDPGNRVTAFYTKAEVVLSMASKNGWYSRELLMLTWDMFKSCKEELRKLFHCLHSFEIPYSQDL